MVAGRGGRTACIAGVGESIYAAHGDVSLAGLVLDAVTAALLDAGVCADEVHALHTESLAMPAQMSTDKLIALARLSGVRSAAYHSGYGAGIGQAVVAAAEAIESGRADTALVYFGGTFGSRLGAIYGLHGAHPLKRDLEFTQGFLGQPVYFAMFARKYAHIHGLDIDELRQAFSEIAVRTRANALLNKRATTRDPLTHEEYRTARMISDPLGLYDCSLVSDGAAAIVLTTKERATDSPHRPVEIVGAGYGQSLLDESSVFTQNPDYPRLPFVRDSADRAFADAGVLRSDIDVAEIYDCFTISLLLQLEDMGLCAPGEGPGFVAGDVFAPDSALPLNTHGGLLSQAYIMGINHIVEAVHQLRGDAGPAQVAEAELALVGLLSAREHASLILGQAR
jgi:acetyl-CoA acetyltransferase